MAGRRGLEHREALKHLKEDRRSTMAAIEVLRHPQKVEGTERRAADEAVRGIERAMRELEQALRSL